MASLRDDIVRVPFPRGSGIIGGLRQGCPEISVCPVPQHLAIPYYAANRQTGSIGSAQRGGLSNFRSDYGYAQDISLELHQGLDLVNRVILFFDRAIYYTAKGYEKG